MDRSGGAARAPKVESLNRTGCFFVSICDGQRSVNAQEVTNEEVALMIAALALLAAGCTVSAIEETTTTTATTTTSADWVPVPGPRVSVEGACSWHVDELSTIVITTDDAEEVLASGQTTDT